VDDFGSYHFERDEVIRFARAYDPQAFHLDDEAGRNSIFGRLAASGWHTTAGMMKCWSAYSFRAARRTRAEQGLALPEIGPSPGIENAGVAAAGLSRRHGELFGRGAVEAPARQPAALGAGDEPHRGREPGRRVKVLSLVSKLMVERRASGQVA
jgi:hypothetical protein